MKQPFVLVNALAARVARDPDLLVRLRRLVPAESVRVTHAPQEVEPAIRAAAAANVETLVIVGGDGSVTGCLTPLLRSWPEAGLPAVVLAGGGSRGAIAHALGTRGAPDQVLERLVGQETEPRSSERHVLEIRPLALGTRYGLGLCIGLPARWLAESGRTSGRGPTGGLFVTARALGSALVGGDLAQRLADPIAAEILIDDERRDGAYFTGLAAGTMDALGLPTRLLPSDAPAEGCFHVALRGQSGWPLDRAAALLGVALPTPSLAHDTLQARTLEVRFAERGGYTVDSDPFPATAVLNVALGPRLRFLSP